MNEITFEPFAKIGRLSREIIITEKIDGTNAQVIVTEDGQVGAASRTRIITLEADNFGFAKWVAEHSDELLALGPGRHFGEWWGSGIQRNYGLKEKRFSLFNVGRWNDVTPPPACCSVVPILHRGPFDTAEILAVMDRLKAEGSKAAPGFMKPEGIVVFHSQSRSLFKKTFEKDEEGKGQAAA